MAPGFPAEVFCHLRIRFFLTEHGREKRIVVFAPWPAHVGIFFAKLLDTRNHQGIALMVYLLWTWFFCADSTKKILFELFFSLGASDANFFRTASE